MLPDDAGRVLLALARNAIAERLGRATTPVTDRAEWLSEPGACFVTLTMDDQLRGCIGSLTARRPLRDDVVGNARLAAFEDRRFLPLTASEFDRVRLEVSVLSAPEPFPVSGRADALAQLVPGVDGLVISAGAHRATFLPQVWEQLPQPSSFLDALQRKAGLPPGGWDRRTRLERYRVRAWTEERAPVHGGGSSATMVDRPDREEQMPGGA